MDVQSPWKIPTIKMDVHSSWRIATIKMDAHSSWRIATIKMDAHTMFRFSDKNQKAIDLLRTKCLKLKCMVSPYLSLYLSILVPIFQSLCDGKLYEIMRGNFERADRTSVIRTTVNSKVNINIVKF